MKKYIKKIMLKINKIGAERRKKKLKSTDFSIISNNCFSGIVYQHYNLLYNTPTIGLYFYPEEYLKFVKNFKRYIERKLTFIKASESKYYDDLKKNNYLNVIIGKLEDIEIVFLHYKTKEEALEKWNRRVKRLSKNIIFKFNDQNECTYENLKEFNDFSYKYKIMFTSKQYPEFESNIFMRKYKKRKCIKEDYYSCYKYFNFNAFINNMIENRY